MSEKWQVQYLGNNYDCLVTYKRMRSIRFRFASDEKTFLVSAPWGTPRSLIRKDLDRFFPKLVRQITYEKPIQGDDIYLFGKKSSVMGFGSTPSLAQRKYLKEMLLPVVKERVTYYSSLMGIQSPYKVRVRDMSTRYGVNSKKTHALTFATMLVHYSLEAIDSVVIHELAHDFVFNHSERFYAIVYKYCPNYKAIHAKLRKHIYE